MAVREVRKIEHTKDGRKWIYEVVVNGTRHKSKKYFTKKEAQDAEREYYNNQIKIGNQSLMSLYDLFLAHQEYQKDKVKITTLSNYSKRMKHFNSIKDYKLDELNIKHIEEWKQEMNSKNLEVGTKNDLLKYLKCVLNFGTKWYDFNFSSLYNKIKNFSDPNALPKEMNIYTYDEFKQFISVENDLKYKTLFETLYYLGLRRGELRGLTWKAIDINKKEISIYQNIVNVDGEGYWRLTTPKTKTSNRKLPIPNVLLDDLIKLKESQKDIIDFNDNWFVFGGLKPIGADAMLRRKNRDADLAKLKRIRLHDFRHSCASLLISKGAHTVMVAKYLGHSKTDITLDCYVHMFATDLDQVVEAIDCLN